MYMYNVLRLQQLPAISSPQAFCCKSRMAHVGLRQHSFHSCSHFNASVALYIRCLYCSQATSHSTIPLIHSCHPFESKANISLPAASVSSLPPQPDRLNTNTQPSHIPQALPTKETTTKAPLHLTKPTQLTKSHPPRFPRAKLPPRRLRPLSRRARRQKRPRLLGRRQRHPRQSAHVEERPAEVQAHAGRCSEEEDLRRNRVDVGLYCIAGRCECFDRVWELLRVTSDGRYLVEESVFSTIHMRERSMFSDEGRSKKEKASPVG